MPTTDLNRWGKLSLLLWKNWTIELPHRRQVLFSIVSPMIFAIALVILGFSVDIEDKPIATYKVINVQTNWDNYIKPTLRKRQQFTLEHNKSSPYNVFVPQLVVCYAPAIEPLIHVMRSASGMLDRTKTKGFRNCDELRQRMLDKHYVAGVCFDHENLANEALYRGYPRHVRFSLIFPSELRFYYDSFIGQTWNTHILYDPVDREAVGGCCTRYIREGFVALQSAVSLSILSNTLNMSTLPRVFIQRFPHRINKRDHLNDGTNIFLSLVVLFGFLYPAMRLTKQIVSERETQLKRILKLMGMKDWIYFLAWFLKGMVFMVMGCILLLFVLKVHWYEGYAFLNRGAWFPLLFFLISYCISALCFCYMISTFTSYTTMATALTGIMWFTSYLPFMMTIGEPQLGSISKLFIFMFSNSAMGMALKKISELEQLGNGLHWADYLTQTASVGSTVAAYTLDLYLLSFIYTFVGLIVESKMLTPATIRRRWIIFRMKWSERRSSADVVAHGFELPSMQSNVSDSKIPCVEIKNVTKIYKGQKVVKDATMNLYRNEITVLMGHNGAGKTTLTSMMTGLVTLTYGTIRINSFDMETQQEVAGANLGISIRDSLLFEDLTVYDQLKFFCRMKGISKYDRENEVEQYLIAMQMHDRKDTLTRHLTIGLRKHLAVCCALIGKSEVVILDEPSTGVDLASRKLLWQMLNHEKFGRMILVTSNYTEETEILADQIVIMSGGTIKCQGSPAQLRRYLPKAFRLFCVLGQHSKRDNLTKVLQGYIPNIMPQALVARETYYTLDEKYLDVIPKLLDELENKSQIFDLDNYSIDNEAVEALFIMKGAEHPSEGNKTRHSQLVGGRSIYVEEYEKLEFLQEVKRLKGCSLWFIHVKVLLLKHFLFDIRNKVLFLMKILMPVFFTLLCLVISRREERYQLKPMTFDLRQYPETRTIFSVGKVLDPLRLSIPAKYIDIIKELGQSHSIENVGEKMPSTYVLEKQLVKSDSFNEYHTCVVGAQIKYNVVAYYNGNSLHSAPLSMNLVYNAMYRAYLDDDVSITVSIELLPYSIKHSSSLVHPPIGIGNLLAMTVAIVVTLVWSVGIMFLVFEHRSRFKLLQFISGARMFTFWMTAFLYDLLQVIVISALIVLTITSFPNTNFALYSISRWYFISLVLFGVCLFSCNYVMSLFLNDPSNAYALVAIFHVFGIVAFFAVVEVLNRGRTVVLDTANLFTWFLSLFPSYLLCNCLVTIFESAEIHNVCSDDVIRLMTVKYNKCKISPNCCHEISVRSWSEGVMWELTFFILETAFGLIFLYVLENFFFSGTRRLMMRIPDDDFETAYAHHKLRHVDDPKYQPDIEVTREQIRVSSLRQRDYYDKTLVCQNVTKLHYGSSKKNINRINLIVERSECLGVIGINGSGKTTFLKLLARDEWMTSGRILVEGASLKHNLFEVYNRIGYCPQECALLPEYTGREAMEMFCLLRGIPPRKVKGFCEGLAKVLGLFPYYNKRLKIYGDGHLRRLSCAIAILGNPKIIYLDEPTSGSDPCGRSQLWNVVSKFLSRGHSVVVSSLHARECERICNKVAVISRGNLQSLGTIQDLMNRLWTGYLLKIKMKGGLEKFYEKNWLSQNARRFTGNPYLKLVTFIETEFADSMLSDYSVKVLVFLIPLTSARLSEIFQKIQQNLESLHIESFQLNRSSLPKLFVEMAEKQHQLFKSGSLGV